MKTSGILGLVVMVISLQGNAQSTSDKFKPAVLPRGERAPQVYFTGNVWVLPIAQDSLAHWSIGKVTFEAGAHSNWHTHSGKQVIIVTEGVSYLKEKGKPLQILRKGDVVTIQPGTKHWHGATPQNGFVQVVMNPEIENGVVNWLERVTEEEYRTNK